MDKKTGTFLFPFSPKKKGPSLKKERKKEKKMREGCDSLECAIRLIVVQRTEAEPRMDSTAIVHLFLFFETLSFAVALSLSLPPFPRSNPELTRDPSPTRVSFAFFSYCNRCPPERFRDVFRFLRLNRRLSSFYPIIFHFSQSN